MKADPATYRKLSEPFESADAAQKAIEAFAEELAQLRKKHHLPNVTVVLKVNVITSDGEEGEIQTYAHLGDWIEAEPMLAWAFGQQQARRQESIAALLKSGVKIMRNR